MPNHFYERTNLTKYLLNYFQAEMFIGLLLKAMKNDVNSKRVAAYAKRILQVICMVSLASNAALLICSKSLYLLCNCHISYL